MLKPTLWIQPISDMLKPTLWTHLIPAMLKPTLWTQAISDMLKLTFLTSPDPNFFYKRFSYLAIGSEIFGSSGVPNGPERS
jgi:hypothetical protein